MISPHVKLAFLEMMVAIAKTPEQRVIDFIDYIKEVGIQADTEEEYLTKILVRADDLNLTDGEFLGAYYHMLVKISYENAKEDEPEPD